MKTKLLLTILILSSIQFSHSQLMDKLKQRAKEKDIKTSENVTYDQSSYDPNMKTESDEYEEMEIKSVEDFFNKDVVLKLIDDRENLTQTLFFDKEVIAMRTEQNNNPNPVYNDSKGYFYAYNTDEGYYEKMSLLPPSLMGFMLAGMIPQFCNLPPEPYLDAFQALEKLDSGLNFLVLEMAFIYKPIHFSDNKNYTPVSVKCNGTSDCIRFDFNDPEYDKSYIQFDDQGRLTVLNIKTTKKFGGEQQNLNNQKTQEPSSGKYVYSYQDCSVTLPDAVEQSMIPGPLGKLIPLEKGLEPWKHNKKDKQKN